MASTQKVTEEQAAEALRALATQAHIDDDEPEPQVAAAPEPEPTPEPEPVVETPKDETPSEVIAASESDDVASLRKRLEERETEAQSLAELNEKRLKATQERFAQNERTMREKYLKKSSVADRALHILEQTRTEKGVSETEVDRVIQEIRGTMSPQSPNYAPPPQQAAYEDNGIVLNSFLNEKGMTQEDSQEFGRWMTTDGPVKMTPQELSIGDRDLDGFLRIAHIRWQEGMREKDKVQQKSDAVKAVQTVQRTQREAAKAAAPVAAAPRKPTTAPKAGVDWKKMSDSEREAAVSALLRQSVEQYR